MNLSTRVVQKSIKVESKKSKQNEQIELFKKHQNGGVQGVMAIIG